MKTVGKVITMSWDEVVKDVMDFSGKLLQENVDAFLNGDVHTINMFNSCKGMKDRTNEDIMCKWCDFCSEKFFETNNDVDEVLMDVTVEKNGGGVVQKYWMASREDVRGPKLEELF